MVLVNARRRSFRSTLILSYELYPKYWLSQDEHHPNAQGMQLIAHSFVNKYIEKYQERATAEADYVYD